MRKNIWKNGLLGLIILQVIIAIALVIFTIINFSRILEQFGVKYQPDMGILQFIMIYNLFLSLSINLWSIIWIFKGNIAGIQGGTTVGFLLFMVSIGVFAGFNRVDILLFDGIRGFLMLVFGVLAYREHKKQYTIIS